MIKTKIKSFFTFLAISYRLISGQRVLYGVFIMLSMAAALTEGIGVSMLVPILESQTGEALATNIPLMSYVSDYFSGMSPTEKIQHTSVILALILVCRGVLLYFVEALGGMIPLKLQRSLFIRGYEALLNVEYSYFTEKSAGDHTNSLIEWVQRVTGLLTNLGSATYSTLLFFVYLALMLSLSWKLAILAGLFSVVTAMALNAFTAKVLRRAGAELSIKSATVAGQIFETISGMKFIKTSAAESIMLPRYEQSLTEKIGTNIKMVLLQSITNPFLSTFAGLFICTLLFLGSLIVGGGEQWVSTLLLFLFLLTRLLAPVSNISSAKVQIASHISAFEQLDAYFRETEKRKQLSGTSSFHGLKSQIELEHINFQYPASEIPAIKDVSLKIPAGKMVAVVGPSGSGKTTLVSLLLRLYEPQGGAIRFDGVDLKDMDVHDLRSHVSVVSQDIFIFNDSVKNNLSFAVDGISDDDIVRAARLASADEFIENLPQAYDAKLGDRGVRLSGGQQQRIAIARAILRDPDLLILDEATSHLDTFTEQAIQDAVEILRKDRTLLVIAHRLSTIRRADLVIVLKNGRVVEQGSHRELMTARGEYWNMVKHQSLDLVYEDEQDEEPVLEGSV